MIRLSTLDMLGGGIPTEGVVWVDHVFYDIPNTLLAAARAAPSNVVAMTFHEHVFDMPDKYRHLFEICKEKGITMVKAQAGTFARLCSPNVDNEVENGLDQELENVLTQEQANRYLESRADETRLVLEGQRLLAAIATHMDGYGLNTTEQVAERDFIIDEARRLAGGNDLKQMAALMLTTGGYLSGVDGDQDLSIDKHEFWLEIRKLCQWDHHADRYWISGQLGWFVYLTDGAMPSDGENGVVTRRWSG